MHKTNAQDREKEVEGKTEKQKEKIEERDRKMLSLLFVVLMIMVFGKLLGIALKATWSIAKIVVTLIFCPVGLLVLVIAGLCCFWCHLKGLSMTHTNRPYVFTFSQMM